VAQPREALQQRVRAEEQQHRHRQQQRPAVVINDREPGGRGDEPDRTGGHRCPIERLGQRAARDRPPGGPRVPGVERRIEQPVHRHRDRPGREHADQDEQDLPPARKVTRLPRGREKGTEQRERQREHRVRNLDVAGKRLEVAEDGRRLTTEARRHGGAITLPNGPRAHRRIIQDLIHCFRPTLLHQRSTCPSPCLPVSLSPCLLVTLSPGHLVAPSPHTTAPGGLTFFGSQRVSYACFTPTRSSSLPATKSTISPTVVGFR